MTAVSSVADVDAWIAQLSECKQLSESDIKKLCDKVKSFIIFNKPSLIVHDKGTRNSFRRIQRSTCKMSCYCVR